METFTASELARRREVLEAALHGDAVLRSTDRVLPRLGRADQDEELERVNQLGALLASAVAACANDEVAPGALGELAWLATWDIDRRRRFLTDLADTIALAMSIGTSAPTDAFLRASQPPTPPGLIFDAADAWDSLSGGEREMIIVQTRHQRANRQG